jgi:uncharacterized protein YciI
MPHFFLKLIPPRPTFADDMSPAEAEVMSAHAAYLTDLAERGIGFAFGPVFDPAGVWGMGIVEATDEAEARGLTDRDPVVVAGIARYAILPMRLSITRK